VLEEGEVASVEVVRAEEEALITEVLRFKGHGGGRGRWEDLSLIL
jgi:hypothetical protein